MMYKMSKRMMWIIGVAAVLGLGVILSLFGVGDPPPSPTVVPTVVAKEIPSSTAVPTPTAIPDTPTPQPTAEPSPTPVPTETPEPFTPWLLEYLQELNEADTYDRYVRNHYELGIDPDELESTDAIFVVGDQGVWSYGQNGVGYCPYPENAPVSSEWMIGISLTTDLYLVKEVDACEETSWEYIPRPELMGILAEVLLKIEGYTPIIQPLHDALDELDAKDTDNRFVWTHREMGEALPRGEAMYVIGDNGIWGANVEYGFFYCPRPSGAPPSNELLIYTNSFTQVYVVGRVDGCVDVGFTLENYSMEQLYSAIDRVGDAIAVYNEDPWTPTPVP